MSPYETLPTESVINETMKMLAVRGFLPEAVSSAEEALARVKSLIPSGASVMNGSSRTLHEIGFIDLLKEGKHGWNNLHEVVLAEKDPAAQAALRKQSALSDFYLGSVHALSQSGELVIASNSASQLPHLVSTSANLILVVGTQKVMPDLDTALARLKEHVFPLEDQRMKEAGMGGTWISKLLIISREPAYTGRKVHIILVNQKLGF